MRTMRVALLHDFLNQYGGAERVLEVLLEVFPEADLYTLLHDPERTGGRFADRITDTSVLDAPLVRRRHRFFIPLFPWATRSFRGAPRYDLVISATAGYAKGFPIEGNCHVTYCYSPLRYAWERDYVDHIPFLPGIAKRVVAPVIARHLQAWDLAASQRPNVFLAISRHIAGKVRAYYRREAQVVYPPVRTDMFYPEPRARRDGYFLMVGRLLHYKRFDLGIRAAEELRVPLKVVGRGPEALRLKRMANPRFVEFIEDADDDALRMLYTGARALVFPQVEDFGLVAAEALACGTPVVAYARGGGGEIIKDGATGAVFQDQSLPALKGAMSIVAARRFDRAALRDAALAFSPSRFRADFLGAVRSAGVPVEHAVSRAETRVPASYAYRR